MIDIGVHVDERRHHMILISAIDNLLKGASGQGVQAINALRMGSAARAHAGGGVSTVVLKVSGKAIDEPRTRWRCGRR